MGFLSDELLSTIHARAARHDAENTFPDDDLADLRRLCAAAGTQRLAAHVQRAAVELDDAITSHQRDVMQCRVAQYRVIHAGRRSGTAATDG